jgi:glycerol-1-phosphate dehydrogenase [NAD(P)+]
VTIWPLPRIETIPLAEWGEKWPIALVTSRTAWEAVAPQLAHLPIVWRGEVADATPAAWDAMAADMQGDVIYAVGGGLAVDAGKYLARRYDKPLICMPTALSVDAFFTAASGVRQDGCVRYIPAHPPDMLIVDFAVLAAAPASVRAAGICDVLSIATGAWDWRFAEKEGANPEGMAYLPWADQAAQGILQGALDCAEAAGAGDPAGLRQLLDCLALEVQLCNQLGHSRPEEGSEHYFAYAVENRMGKGLPHGDLVGPGIVLMAEKQGLNTAPLRRALADCHVPLDRIPPAVVEATLAQLPAYVRRHKLPFGIAHVL